MANNISKIIPLILTQALLDFRNNSVTANLVNRNFDDVFRKKGDTINIPNYNTGTVQDVVTGRGNEGTPSDVIANTVPVTLEHWKKIDIQLDDFELKKIEDGRVSEILQKQVIGLVDYVDSWLLLKLQESGYNIAGAVGSPIDTNAFVDGGGFLSKENVPMRGRSAIVSVDTSNTLIKDQKIVELDKSGSPEALRDARVSRLFSFDLYNNNNLEDFSGGTLTNGTAKTADTATALVGGETTILLEDTTLTGTLVKGDVFSISGKDGYYVVTADTVASGNQISVNISPAIRESVTVGTAVNFVADHENSGILLQEEAFVFATAPLVPSFTGGNIVETQTDPKSGISLTLEVERVNKTTIYSISILYGGNVIRPEGICRLVS